MKGTTRITAALVLITQWVGQLLAFEMRSVLAKALTEIEVRFPPHTKLAIHMTEPVAWFALGAISTAVVLASEIVVKTDRNRLLLQICYATVWSLLSFGAIWAMVYGPVI